MPDPKIPDYHAYIIVDIESAGPSPVQYAMLSIGACTLAQPRQSFYVELQPDKDAVREESLAVSGLDMQRLPVEGRPPAEAMQAFADWLADVVPDDTEPIFTAFNAPFDWLFTDHYFQRYLGHNPFGYKALDIKALYMGHAGVPWIETAHMAIAPRYGLPTSLPHNALEDAHISADLLDALLHEIFLEEKSDERQPQPKS